MSADEIPEKNPDRARWLADVEEQAMPECTICSMNVAVVRALIKEIHALDTEIDETWKALKSFDHTGRQEPLSSCAEVAVAAYQHLEHARNEAVKRIESEKATADQIAKIIILRETEKMQTHTERLAKALLRFLDDHVDNLTKGLKPRFCTCPVCAEARSALADA